MELQEAIKGRRSVRRFTDEKVSHETIEKIVDLARMSPSWKNSQTVRYVVIEDPAIIQKIAADCVLNFEFNQKTLEKAQTVVLLTTVTKRCGYEKDGSFTTSKGAAWEMFDAGIAAQTFCLAAYEYGIGSVILGIFDDAAVGEAAGIPEGQVVSAIIPIGVPKFAPDPTPRKEVADLLSYR